MLYNHQYIEEFYEKEIKNKYPFSLEQIKEICTAPYKMLKNIMNSNDLEDVRIKYLGLFKVSKRRLNYYKINLIKKYEEGRLSEKQFNYKMKIFENEKT